MLGKARPMPQQAKLEGRQARGIGQQGARWQGRHLPAAARGAGRCGTTAAQQQGQDAGGLGRQGQAPAFGQAERLGIAPEFEQDHAQFRAARRVDRGLQAGDRILAAHQDDPAGIAAERREPGRMQPSGLAAQPVLAHPQDRPLAGGTAQQPQRQPGRGRQIAMTRRLDLVQRAALKTAGQEIIQPGKAEADRADGRLGRWCRHRQTLPQLGQYDRCSRHASGPTRHVHYLFS